jgi:hypothetical protein
MGSSASSDGGSADTGPAGGSGGTAETPVPASALGSPPDRELWERLRAILAGHPGGAGERSLAGDAARTVREIAELADTVAAALAATDAPAGPGTARAVGSSLAQLCLAFTRAWSAQPPVTPAQHAEFDRDLTVVRTILGSMTGLGPGVRRQP